MYTLESLKQEVTNLETELSHLLTTKAEKVINEILQKEHHTQLSYLNKEQQETHRLFGKKAVLTIAVSSLQKL